MLVKEDEGHKAVRSPLQGRLVSTYLQHMQLALEHFDGNGNRNATLRRVCPVCPVCLVSVLRCALDTPSTTWDMFQAVIVELLQSYIAFYLLRSTCFISASSSIPSLLCPVCPVCVFMCLCLGICPVGTQDCTWKTFQTVTSKVPQSESALVLV